MARRDEPKFGAVDGLAVAIGQVIDQLWDVLKQYAELHAAAVANGFDDEAAELDRQMAVTKSAAIAGLTEHIRQSARNATRVRR